MSKVLIQVADSSLSPSPVVIAYGDVRFTNPSNTVSTDPKVRRWNPLGLKIVDFRPEPEVLNEPKALANGKSP